MKLLKLIRVILGLDDGPDDPVCQDNECQPW